MPKPIPLEPGCYYHIYNRGTNRENIFIESRNYLHFLKLYGKYVEPIADTLAYCLLPNHFHLLVRIKERVELQDPKGLADPSGLDRDTPSLRANPSGLARSAPRLAQTFSNLFNAYAKAINLAYGRSGSLFQHPFGRIKIKSSEHFVRLITYIHQNPQKHGLIDDFRDWPYSSYQAVLSPHPTRIKRDDILKQFESVRGFQALHNTCIPESHVRQLTGNDED